MSDYYIIEHLTRGIVRDVDEVDPVTGVDLPEPKVRWTLADYRTDERCKRFATIREASEVFWQIPAGTRSLAIIRKTPDDPSSGWLAFAPLPLEEVKP